MKFPVVVEELGATPRYLNAAELAELCDGSTRSTGFEQRHATRNSWHRRRCFPARRRGDLVLAAGVEIELAFFSRMGAVLVAAWLAYEDVQAARLAAVLLPVILVVLARWPRLLWLLLPALAAWVILRRLLSTGQR